MNHDGTVKRSLKNSCRRELDAHVDVDVSRLLIIGCGISRNVSLAGGDCVRALAFFGGRRVARNNDKVGLILFTDEVEKY